MGILVTKIFTSTPPGGVWTIPTGVTVVEVMVVAGGGGGGAYPTAGGGGGGGVIYRATFTVTPESDVTVTIGAGGLGGQHNTLNGFNGDDSVFSSLTAKGGGYGSSKDDTVNPGGDGGCGGGGCGGMPAGGQSGGNGGQGGNGGSGFGFWPAGGGGGGASPTNGADATSGNGGDGGAGYLCPIDSNRYAGGGGGSGYFDGCFGLGADGGGNGAQNNPPSSPGDGGPNSGGGGGGGGNNASFMGGNGGSGIIIVKYTAPPPIVTSLNPNSGITTGGTPITIYGAYFVSGATATIDGNPCTDVAFVNSGALTAKTPSGSLGAKDVVVTNPDTQFGTLALGYTYFSTKGPTITSIVPSSGKTVGGTAVTINGTDFVAPATIKIDGNLCSNIIFVSSIKITAKTPAGTAGAKNVVATNPDTQYYTLIGGFTYIPPPNLVSINPNSGKTAGGTAVTLGGSDFITGCTVTIDGNPCSDVTFVSSTEVTAKTPPGTLGAKDVVLTNPDLDAQFDTLVNGYTYFLIDGPIINTDGTGIVPNTGPTTGGTAVTINGSNFIATPTVTIDGNLCSSIVRVSANQLTAVTPPGTVGAKDVVVANPDTQYFTLFGGFTYVGYESPPCIIDLKGILDSVGWR